MFLHFLENQIGVPLNVCVSMRNFVFSQKEYKSFASKSKVSCRNSKALKYISSHFFFLHHHVPLGTPYNPTLYFCHKGHVKIVSYYLSLKLAG